MLLYMNKIYVRYKIPLAKYDKHKIKKNMYFERDFINYVKILIAELLWKEWTHKIILFGQWNFAKISCRKSLGVFTFTLFTFTFLIHIYILEKPCLG